MAGRSLREVAEGLMYFLGCVGASMGTRDSGVRPLRVPVAVLLRRVDVDAEGREEVDGAGEGKAERDDGSRGEG